MHLPRTSHGWHQTNTVRCRYGFVARQPGSVQKLWSLSQTATPQGLEDGDSAVEAEHVVTDILQMIEGTGAKTAAVLSLLGQKCSLVVLGVLRRVSHVQTEVLKSILKRRRTLTAKSSSWSSLAGPRHALVCFRLRLALVVSHSTAWSLCVSNFFLCDKQQPRPLENPLVFGNYNVAYVSVRAAPGQNSQRESIPSPLRYTLFRYNSVLG